MSTGEWQEHEEPEIGARHLLLCREVIWNAHDAEAPYTLRGMLAAIQPTGEFPLVWDQPMSVFAQFFGAPGEYEVWVELVRLVFDESGEIHDEVEQATYGPFVIALEGTYFLRGRALFLRRVPFSAPGIYEFRLRAAGVFAPLASERLSVEG